MNFFKEFIKTHQQKLVLVTGYLLVAVLAFELGRFTIPKFAAPQIRTETVFAQPGTDQINYTPDKPQVQSSAITTSTQNCDGKIKVSSSGIYHIPDGAFYDRVTKPIKCFDSEAQAIAAGFRKSSK